MKRALILAPLLAMGGCTTSDLELAGAVLSLAADIAYLTSDDVCPYGQSAYYNSYGSVDCGYSLDDNDHHHGRGGHRRDD